MFCSLFLLCFPMIPVPAGRIIKSLGLCVRHVYRTSYTCPAPQRRLKNENTTRLDTITVPRKRCVQNKFAATLKTCTRIVCEDEIIKQSKSLVCCRYIVWIILNLSIDEWVLLIIRLIMIIFQSFVVNVKSFHIFELSRHSPELLYSWMEGLLGNKFPGETTNQ